MSKKITIVLLAILTAALTVKTVLAMRLVQTLRTERAAQRAELASAEDSHGESGEIVLAKSVIDQIGIETKSVHREDIAEIIPAFGEIRTTADATVRVAAPYSSEVISIAATPGETVRAGAVIAVLMNRETFAHYTVTAPKSGTVVERLANRGELVSDGDILVTLVDLRQVVAELSVNELKIGAIRRGASVEIKNASEPTPFSGRVLWIGTEIDRERRTVPIRVSLEKIASPVLPGTFVQASIESNRKRDAVVVERSAIVDLNGESTLFVPHDEPGSFRPVAVTTGRKSETVVEILSGITEGEQYVSKGAFALKSELVTANMDPHAGHGH